MPFYRTQLTTISPALHIKSSRLAPSGPLSFYQSFPRFFLQAAESGVFSKVRVCEAKRSNESPSGAFKRQNGLAQQDGGALPRQVTFYVKESRLCAPCAERPNIREMCKWCAESVQPLSYIITTPRENAGFAERPHRGHNTSRA